MEHSDQSTLVQRYNEVLANVQTSLRQANRTDTITIVAVSKGVEAADVQALRAHGHIDFGESRAQDFTQRLSDIAPSRWHFIGRLQSNKLDRIVGRVAIIHSLGSVEHAKAIAQASANIGHVQRAFLQVNVSNDPNKAGIAPEKLMQTLGQIRSLRNLSIQGLATIPMANTDPQPAFRQLAQLRDEAQDKWPEITQLSMGMSQDYQIAIVEGATHIRVGSAIFREQIVE